MGAKRLIIKIKQREIYMAFFSHADGPNLV